VSMIRHKFPLLAIMVNNGNLCLIMDTFFDRNWQVNKSLSHNPATINQMYPPMNRIIFESIFFALFFITVRPQSTSVLTNLTTYGRKKNSHSITGMRSEMPC